MTTPRFADQAALWLDNDTIPLRLELDDVPEGATDRETFVPADHAPRSAPRGSP